MQVIEGILAAVSGVVCLPVLAAMSPVSAVTQYVDPLIGCAKDGHTYPGPTCPFGLVQPGPDSGNGDWAHCSGYVNADDRIFGFYPLDPCGGEYVIGAPQVPSAALNLANGKVFTMTAKNLSKENKYVKSMTLNDRPITDWKIRHEDVMKGGEFVFEMTAK